MNFTEAKETQAKLRARRATHWIVLLVTPAASEYREMPKSNPDRKVFGFFPADMLDGATVYAAGAECFKNCREVVALPSPAWKGLAK